MYTFTDTDATPGTPSLPAEAMKYNGVFLENEVTGYRTLNVSGRESVSEEINEIETHGRDGNYYLSRRYKPRTIIVTYQLISASDSAFRTAYNKINKLLDGEQVQIIFNDELDKYFIGTRVNMSDPPAGINSVIGEIEIYCTDPHKYSTTEYSATASGGEFVLNYDGTYKSYPTFVATCASDLGFVSYVDSKEHVIQIGDPDEDDMEQNQHKTTQISESFTGSLPSGWTTNNATLEPDVASYVQQGSMTTGTTGLKANSYGTNTTTRHGPSRYKTVTAAANFDLSFDLTLYATSVKQIGEVMVMCTGTVSGAKTVICSMHVTKSGDGSYNGTVYDYVMGEQKNATRITVSQGNKFFGSGGRCTIRKNGDTFTFMANGIATFETRVAGTEDYTVTEVAIFFNQKKQLPALNTLAIKNFKYDTYSTEWDDVPNKFSSGDVITADCAAGAITVNGAEQYGLGALGNDWETFCLVPGVNTIKCLYSDWATAPTFVLKYRKVYL